jgi:hypothetical protein
MRILTASWHFLLWSTISVEAWTTIPLRSALSQPQLSSAVSLHQTILCAGLNSCDVDSIVASTTETINAHDIPLHQERRDHDTRRPHESENISNIESQVQLSESFVSRRAWLGTAAAACSVAVLASSSTPASAASMTESIQTPGMTTTTTVAATAPAVDVGTLVQQAARKAVGGGQAGAAAAVVQVSTLMWLRTAMNYQYRYGGTLKSSLSTLYDQGGIPRLYQGLPFALLQGPLTRFGDTAANVGILALLQSWPVTQEWPLPLMTAAGSATAGLWRILLMPMDASKTILQVEGRPGLDRLWTSVQTQGPSPLYRGALAQAAATAAGHFPWFLTYNFLNTHIIPASEWAATFPAEWGDVTLWASLLRAAGLGFGASCVSDCVSNSLRVIKTTKQTAQVGDNGQDLSYPEIVKMIVQQDGVVGLLGRGLQTRLLTNAIQGAAFSVLWRYFQQVGGM